MIKIALLVFSMLGIAQANSAVIDSIDASHRLILRNHDGEVTAMPMPHAPLQFCAARGINQWVNSFLRGKAVKYTQSGFLVNWGGQWHELGRVLTRAGFVYDPRFVNELVLSAAENRGEWQCTKASALFDLVVGNNQGVGKVLASIALQESGVKNRPWPWTLNVAGKSMYYETKQAAYEALKGYVASGNQSVDVGLMQVNYRYHKHRFATMVDMLEPSINIRTAQAILLELFSKYGSWETAIKCYHNCLDGQKNSIYFARVMNYYHTLK